MKLTFERKLPLILFFVFVLLVAIGFVSYQYTVSIQESARQIRETRRALVNLEEVNNGINDADWFVRGFFLTGNSTYADRLDSQRLKLDAKLRDLRAIYANDNSQSARLNELEAAVSAYWTLAASILEDRKVNGPSAVDRRTSLLANKNALDKVRTAADSLREAEQAAADEFSREIDSDLYRTVRILIFASLAGVISLLVANTLVWTEGRRRAAAERALVDANRDLEVKVIERTDELRQLNESLKLAAEERERLLANEQAARREAEIANRLRDEFMATVSHELRTPLNSILGWARMIYGGTLDEKQEQKALGTIIKNSETQNRLIEDLLDVARLISGKLELEMRALKIAEVVGHSIESVRPAAELKRITVSFNASDNAASAEVTGDQDRLVQVFTNLMTNSVKFTPEGGTIFIELSLNGSAEAQVMIEDSGIGISAEFLPMVFERFRQDVGTEARKSGLGLGLAIVRNLVEMHGGSVAAHSEGEDKGAVFTVRLPLRIES